MQDEEVLTGICVVLGAILICCISKMIGIALAYAFCAFP